MLNIKISDRALAELKHLGAENEAFLRVSVIPGGCSGMTYSANLDSTMREGDELVFQSGGVRLVSDAKSASFLEGLKIDYSDDLVQSGFQFKNPNAVKSCGCGASFAI